MRTAAYHMVKHMAAGMALITCRDPLLITISKHLRNVFIARGVSDDQKLLVDQAANQVSRSAAKELLTFPKIFRIFSNNLPNLAFYFQKSNILDLKSNNLYSNL